jgi:hydroxyacylglutathione hydrolase
MIDVRSFAVGPIQENSYIVRASADARVALLIDPGEEPQKLLAAAETLGVQIEAILLTHCHFDHIGAVAPIARATGAPVYCPELERAVLTDVMRWVPPGFGPFESWKPEHTLKGGERLTLAGLQIEVLFTPGHSPGHLTYAITPATDTAKAPTDAEAEPPALLSGDVLFKGSVGRVDLPGGDWATLERSIGMLMESFPAKSTVHPGHMGITTLGAELQSNPFLTELRQGAALAVPAERENTSP